MDEEIRVCSMCGCELQENETVEVDGEAVCDECAEQYTTTCDHCGETIWAEDAVTDEHMNLCSCCWIWPASAHPAVLPARPDLLILPMSSWPSACRMRSRTDQ